MNLKSTAIALALCSSATYAGTMGPVCVRDNLTVPCAAKGWDFGIQALSLRPSYSSVVDSAGVNLLVNQFVNPTNNLGFLTNSPGWEWAFKLDGSYHFQTGNDLDVSWYHLGRRTSNRTYEDVFQPVPTLPTPPLPPLPTNLNTSYLSIKPGWDAVNLELGQRVYAGRFEKMRFFGGFQFAHIQTWQRVLNVIPAEGLVSNFFNNMFVNKASYSGFGPRVGMNLAYGWDFGLNMYADAAAQVLVGGNGTHGTFVQVVSPPTFLPFLRTFEGSGSTVSVVPGLEAKLGLTYNWLTSQGNFMVDIGWMWANYFKAQRLLSFTEMQTFAMNNGFLAVTPTAAGPLSPQAVNFGIQGPYAGIKWRSAAIA